VRQTPLTHSTYLVQKQLNRERNLRSQLCDLTELLGHKGHKCNNTDSNTINR